MYNIKKDLIHIFYTFTVIIIMLNFYCKNVIWKKNQFTLFNKPYKYNLILTYELYKNIY